MGQRGISAAVIGAAADILNVNGMLLVYRTDKFLNFAQVQLGIIAVAVFDAARRSRILLRTIDAFCVDCSANAGTPLLLTSFVLSAMIALLIATGVSVLVQATIMHRMRHAPRLMSTVITVSIAQALAALGPAILRSTAQSDENGSGATLHAGFNPIKGVFRSAVRPCGDPMPIPAAVTAYRIPGKDSPDWAPLQVLGRILAFGGASRLGEQLVLEGYAQEVRTEPTNLASGTDVFTVGMWLYLVVFLLRGNTS